MDTYYSAKRHIQGSLRDIPFPVIPFLLKLWLFLVLRRFLHNVLSSNPNESRSNTFII